MKSTLVKKLKKYLFSPAAPDFLFEPYFDRLLSKNRKQLKAMIDGEKDLIEHLPSAEQEYWMERINDVLQGPDNADIPRDVEAGKLNDTTFVMHNGILIDPLSYYSFPLLKMLVENKGVHEPQEEKIFQEVLKLLPKKPMTMLELGSYWSFYSMWFMKEFPDARCLMVEPDRRNLFYGKRNLKLNKMQGTFMHAGIGEQVDRSKNITTVDAICRQQKLEFIDILHSDIQGFELEMLRGSKQLLSESRVGYIFISTHSNELHYDCRQLLVDQYGFTEVASADLDETFSWDGILVMKAPHYKGIETVPISKKLKTSV